jgi:hypothetical protein
VRTRDIRLRARLIRHLRVVYRLGERPIAELVIEVAEKVGACPLLEELAERYARLDPVILRDIGGDRFPASPIRIIAGGRP